MSRFAAKIIFVITYDHCSKSATAAVVVADMIIVDTSSIGVNHQTESFALFWCHY